MPKYMIADSSLYNQPEDYRNYRGVNVFTLSELRGVTGVTKRGETMTGKMQMPLFTLSPDERIGIMQSAGYVQAVVGSRMNRIAAAQWDIIHKKEIEEDTIQRLRDLKQIYDEYDNPNDLKHLVLRFKIKTLLQKELPDLRDDLVNFSNAMLRYKKQYDRKVVSRKQEIVDWLNNCNPEDDFFDLTKKWVESLMIHGATALFKDYTEDYSIMENFYVLPGGTTYPLRSVHVGGLTGYVQMVVGHMPKIYFKDEMTFTNYLPSAARSYGYVPLDALINKISEQLLFDQFAAERADGTKEPEKMVVWGDQRPTAFGDLTGELSLPTLTEGEQKRVEEKINMLRKGAVVTLQGVGHPLVLDISKADTFQAQSDRQDKLLRDVALVFNMTNMEINLAGGEFTSGKETSEEQGEIEAGKGTGPIMQKWESIICRDILPYRFGTDHIFKYKKTLTETEQVKLDALRFGSGTWTKNEIRSARGDDPIFEAGNDSLNQPEGAKPAAPDGSQLNPFNMKAI